ncbi:MAG: OmpA family protein [Gammaproteobacteria bacterium]|nr:OmpA family protein [Gammaproteobacteria bacterium]
MFQTALRKRRLIIAIALALGSTTLSTGCNPVKPIQETFASDDPCSNNARNAGALLGGVSALLIARNNIDSPAMIALASAAGAGIGALIGSDIDERRCELSKISKEYKVPIQAEPITSEYLGLEAKSGEQKDKPATVGLKVSLQDVGNQFESGSDKLTPQARGYFTKVARTYSPNHVNVSDSKKRADLVELLKTKKIVVIGHTDDSGTSTKNADLSEKRAKVVAEIFAAEGVPRENLYFQGAGDVYPIADNNSKLGREKNRRAEIIEMPNEQTLQAYLSNQPKRVDYYSQKTVSNPADGKNKPTSVVSANQDSVQSVKSTSVKGFGFDLGGVPVSSYKPTIVMGSLKTSMLASLSPISTANASNQLVYQSVCSVDQYRDERSIKNLATNRVVTSMKKNLGIQGWSAKNASYIAESDKAKMWLTAFDLAQGYSGLSDSPKLKVKTPSKVYDFDAKANVYETDTTVQYRIFFDKAPMSCMDVYFDKAAPNNPGYVVYQKSNELFSANFNFN